MGMQYLVQREKLCRTIKSIMTTDEINIRKYLVYLEGREIHSGGK